LSTTRAAASSSHILKFCSQKFVKKKKKFKVRTLSTQLGQFSSEIIFCPYLLYIVPPPPSTFELALSIFPVPI
jgi:hypothetical protein